MVSGASTILPLDLSGLRVAITGAAGGIGRVMADGFRACGGSVFISDLDAAALAASGHVGMIADAGEAAAMENFVDAALAHLGGLDVLINNAGIAGPTAPVEDVTPAELEETLRVDLSAMFHCARRAVPALRAAGADPWSISVPPPDASASRCAAPTPPPNGASSASPRPSRSSSVRTASTSTPSYPGWSMVPASGA